MAQNSYALLEGEVVATGAVTGPFRKCPSCDHDRARITLTAPGKHLAQLDCASCGTRVSWLGRDHLAALLAQKKGAA